MSWLPCAELVHVTHIPQNAQLQALEQHRRAAEVLLDVTGKALTSDSTEVVVSVNSALIPGVRKCVNFAPSAVPVATSVGLRLDPAKVLHALEGLRAGLIVHKGPCAKRCTLQIMPYTPAPNEADFHFVLELRYVIVRV